MQESNPNPKTEPETQNELVQEQLQCPRCGSKNTKFCYYNNYKLSQPRHYCKTCRRYWTKGGALRNVPVRGGCRRPSPKRAASKKAIFKTSTSPATSSSLVELPLDNTVPAEMSLVPVFHDPEGYFGNFNMGWPNVAPEIRRSDESSIHGGNGDNEGLINGDLTIFLGGWP